MKTAFRYVIFLALLTWQIVASAAICVGLGKTDITPPIGTPSAGYTDRKGEGMQGVHDPLLAIALYLDNGEKRLALCSVDHLGFTYSMVQDITHKVHAYPGLADCDVYIASSHTHSGGGAYLDIPVLGESLAGTYSPNITSLYIEKTAEAIIQAYEKREPSKVGIGYGKAGDLSAYRGLWPQGVIPLADISIIKVTHVDGSPLALLFNYPVHPTVLRETNRSFSADFVGYARNHLQSSLGSELQPIYVNGAQGDIVPVILNEEDRFDACDLLGKALAKRVKAIWDTTETSDTLEISTQKESYALIPQPTPFGLLLPISTYQTEINVIVLNRSHAFLTIPGELSCLYDQKLKEIGERLGFSHVSIFGLTNDAHGYIILPESWKYKTYESGLSFGGANYGETVRQRAEALLLKAFPKEPDLETESRKSSLDIRKS